MLRRFLAFLLSLCLLTGCLPALAETLPDPQDAVPSDDALLSDDAADPRDDSADPAQDPDVNPTDGTDPADDLAADPTDDVDPADNLGGDPTDDTDPADDLADDPTDDAVPADDLGGDPTDDADPADDSTDDPTDDADPADNTAADPTDDVDPADDSTDDPTDDADPADDTAADPTDDADPADDSADDPTDDNPVDDVPPAPLNDAAGSALRFLSQPEDVFTAVGRQARFYVSLSSTQGVTLQWQVSVDGGATWQNSRLNGYNTGMIFFTVTSGHDGRLFRCVATDADGGTVTSDAALLTVYPLPEFTLQPQDLTIRHGKRATFTVELKSMEGIQLQWQTSEDGGATWRNSTLDGSNSKTLSFDATVARSGRLFRCAATDANGSRAFSSAALLTCYVPASFAVHPSDAMVEIGDSGSFSVTPKGTGTIDLQWQVSTNGGKTWQNSSFEGSTAGTLRFTMAPEMNGWKFRCVASDSYGNRAASKAATLMVQVFTQHPAGLDVALDTPVTISAKVTDDSYTLRWQVSKDGGSSWAGTDLPAGGSGTYSCLSFNAAKEMKGWQFRCEASGNGIVTYSNPATLNVANIRILKQPENAYSIYAPAFADFGSYTSCCSQVIAQGEGLSYEWYFSGGEPFYGYAEFSGFRSSTLWYRGGTGEALGVSVYCLITDKYGDKVKTETVSFSTGGPPAIHIDADPVSREVPDGTPVTFSVKAHGGFLDALSYKWQISRDSGKTWTDLYDDGYDSNTTISITARKSMNGTMYRALVTDLLEMNIETTNAAVLTVYPRLQITGQPPVYRSLIVGETALFRVTATGSGTLVYQWETSTDGGATWGPTGLNGCRTDTLSFTATEKFNGRMYRCRVTDDRGNTLTSREVTLNVSRRPVITRQPQSLNLNHGQTAVFTVEASGDDLRYRWETSIDGGVSWESTALNGCETPTLSFTATIDRDNRRFRCVVTNPYGLKTVSEEAVLRAGFEPIVFLMKSAVTAGEGQTISIDAKVNYGVGDLRYQWQTRTGSTGEWTDADMAGSATNTLSIHATTSLNGAQFRCYVTDSVGCRDYSNAITLTVVALPVITSQPRDVSVRAGQKAVFSVAVSSQTGLAYRWQTSIDGGASWSFSTLSGYRTDTLSFAAATIQDGRMYRCIATDTTGNFVCSRAVTLHVSPNPLGIARQPMDVTLEAGKTATFSVKASGGSGALSYRWETSADGGSSWSSTDMSGSTTAYLNFTAAAAFSGLLFRCIVTDAKGSAVTSDAAVFTLIGAPAISRQPADVSAASGDTAVFSVAVSGGSGTLSYQWQTSADGGASWSSTSLNGCRTATLSFSAIRSRDGRLFRCVVTDGSGRSVTSRAATLRVDLLTLVQQPVSLTVPSGKTASFTVKAAGGSGALSYQWQTSTDGGSRWGNTGLSGNATPTLSFGAALSFSGRMYRCVVTDSEGNQLISAEVTLTVAAGE